MIFFWMLQSLIVEENNVERAVEAGLPKLCFLNCKTFAPNMIAC